MSRPYFEFKFEFAYCGPDGLPWTGQWVVGLAGPLPLAELGLHGNKVRVVALGTSPSPELTRDLYPPPLLIMGLSVLVLLIFSAQ